VQNVTHKHTPNAQYDAQIMNIIKMYLSYAALMQWAFKFQSSANHHGHLIPVPKGYSVTMQQNIS